jgi:hypothetical protein
MSIHRRDSSVRPAPSTATSPILDVERHWSQGPGVVDSGVLTVPSRR